MKNLTNTHNWKQLARWTSEGFYELRTEDTRDVPVRMFLTERLMQDAEDILYRQIVNATRFPGVKLVVITPDVHYGYGVPVGCVILPIRTRARSRWGPWATTSAAEWSALRVRFRRAPQRTIASSNSIAR